MIITTLGESFPLPRPRSPGTSFAMVHLRAGGIIPRKERRCIDRYDTVRFVIEADPMSPTTPGLRPNDFNSKTIQWALQASTLIVPWAGMIPFDRDYFASRLEAHTLPGKRIALLLIRDEHHDEWVVFAAKHARKHAEFLAVRGDPDGVNRQTCSTSRAFH